MLALALKFFWYLSNGLKMCYIVLTHDMVLYRLNPRHGLKILYHLNPRHGVNACCIYCFHYTNFQDFVALSKELNQAREKILECTDEINDMKAERSNTRVKKLESELQHSVLINRIS